MRHDRVAAVHNLRVIAPLVEHSHVGSDHRREVNGAVHGALVRADDHQVLAVHLDVRNVAEQSLCELVGGCHILKGTGRNRVLYARVMRVKCDDGIHSEIHKLLKRYGTIEGFSRGTLVLAALVKERHDDRNPGGFAAHGADNALQIGEMVVGGHVVNLPADFIGQAVVTYIYEDVNVQAANRFVDDALGFTGTEAGTFGADQVGVSLIAVVIGGVGVFGVTVVSPGYDPIVYHGSDGLAAFEGNDSHRAVGHIFNQSLLLFRHRIPPW